MFTSLHLLPQFNGNESVKYQYRWKDYNGRQIFEKIIKMIENGAGEDFLEYDFDKGNLGFLENKGDLKGVDIFKKDINFPEGDNFEGIDFSYAQFYHSKFHNANFIESSFEFARLYNCVFENCLFAFSTFYGCKIEKVKFINCDFVENNAMTNCVFNETKYKNCFYSNVLFSDCKFDSNTSLDAPKDKPSSSFNTELNKTQLAEIYKSIKEAYFSGGVFTKSKQYLFKQKQSITRHNEKGKFRKIGNFLLELITGYGIRPMRVLVSMLLFFALFSYAFIGKLGFAKGILLSAGAFFTFGANANYLQYLSNFYKILYIFEAFTGISMIALFIVVLSNLWFTEK